MGEPWICLAHFRVQGSASVKASSTVPSESHCALGLPYVDLVVSFEVAVEVCCFCVTFHCIQLLDNG